MGIACGGSSSANNSYAVISSYSTNTDVCKLRIDFDTMVLTSPATVTSAVAAVSLTVGDCIYDSLTVSNPGGAVPPTICGYNTGQHMYVPASPQCNQINIDIDTLTTTTTRKWQIKVTQFECGNMMAPEQDCLQYHTASSGTIASFNWDTSASTVSSTQYHLSSQFYDICIRRARSYCSVCYSPYVHSSTTGTATSYGVGGSSLGPAQTGAIATYCTGVTTQPAAAGFGDYLEIANLQPSIGSSGTVNTKSRICGAFWNAGDNPQTSHATACSFAIPFKVGIHFDGDESIKASPIASPNLNKAENDPAATNGAGYGYSGFWLRYWQNSC